MEQGGENNSSTEQQLSDLRESVSSSERRIRDLEATVTILSSQLRLYSADYRPSAQPIAPPVIAPPQPEKKPPQPEKEEYVPPPIQFADAPLQGMSPIASSPESRRKERAESEASSERAAENNEYFIGGKLLPWIGAVITIIGIAFLVAVGVQRNLITPPVLWWGINLGLAGVLALGHRLRNEREAFGELVAGIASAGFFLNFVAGYGAQHIYGIPTFTILILAHSFANLAYAQLRVSQAFLTLGALGGFIGALVPAHIVPTPVCSGLILLVTTVACLSAAQKKWMELGLLIAVGASFSTLLLGFAASLTDLSVQICYLALAFPAIACTLHSYEGARLKLPQTAMVGLLTNNAITVSIWLHKPPFAFLCILYVGCLLAFTRWKNAPNDCVQSLILASVIIGFFVVPIGFVETSLAGIPSLMPWLFVGSTATLLGWNLFKRDQRSWMLALCGGLLVCASVVLIFEKDSPVSGLLSVPITPPQELALWVAELVFVVGLAFAAVRAFPSESKYSEPAGVLVGMLLLARICYLAVPILGYTGRFAQPVTIFVVLMAVLLGHAWLWLASKRKDFGLVWVGLVTMLVFYCGIMAATGSEGTYLPPSVGTETIMLVPLVLLCASLAFLHRRLPSAENEDKSSEFGNWGLLVSQVVLFGLGLRFAWVWGPRIFVGTPAEKLTIYALGLGIVFHAFAAMRTRQGEYAVISGFAAIVLMFLVGLRPLSDYLEQPEWLRDIGLVAASFIAILISLIALGQFMLKDKSQRGFYTLLVTVESMALLSRLGYLGLSASGAGMNPNAAVSLSWIAVGVSLLGIGFWLQVREFRYASFAVFAGVVAKAFFVDLVNLDSAIRALIFLALGAVLVASGFVYIRFQRHWKGAE